ncbi:MAG TPA: DUF6624 domain-containing protein [Gemmataceae bacterium]|nr:DUF6624 domain-containing protein [Gemmataceae bacterium]
MRWLYLAFMFVLSSSALADGPIQDPALARELKARTETDQDARFALIQFEARTGWNKNMTAHNDAKVSAQHRRLLDKMTAIDRDNTAWLKGIVDKQGWPGRSRVGKEAAHLAWLLGQHADRDRPFQKQCLALMRKLPRVEVDQQDIAYLTDRVAAGEGKKQTYGTQLRYEHGKLVPHPAIEDEAHVDRRRTAVGMQPLKDYIAFCEKMMRGDANKAGPKKP